MNESNKNFTKSIITRYYIKLLITKEKLNKLKFIFFVLQ